MASATGIPEHNVAEDEQQPLLGRPGDVVQKPGQGLQYNLITGTGEYSSNERENNTLPHPFSQRRNSHLMQTMIQFLADNSVAILAQAGTWILAALIWAAVFEHNVIFFSVHPVSVIELLLELAQLICHSS